VTRAMRDQATSSRVEMGNPKLVLNQSTVDNISVIHNIISKVDYV